MTERCQNVIFDVGRVLIHWDMRLVFRRFLPDDAAIADFLAETGWHAWNYALDRGGNCENAISELAARHPQYRPVLEASHRCWHDSVPGPIDGTVDILEALHAAGTPLYAITNFSLEKWRETRERFGFLSARFRDVVVSGEEGVVKPDPEIYRRCLERNGLAAGDCVFIDDSADNVAAARRMGIDGVQFTDPPSLRAALRARGIPV